MAGWNHRIAKAIDEIDRTLDGPLDVDALSGTAACSRFHFQRLFSAIVGISVGEYRRLMLLRRAGQQLAFRGNVSVTEIGFDAGYENAESFSRAFRRAFGQSPSGFRTAPDWAAWHRTYDPLLEKKGRLMPDTGLDFDSVRIADFPETKVAVLKHRGPASEVPASVQRFIAWRKAHGTPPPRSATYNILYDDPKTTPAADFRMDICCAETGAIAENGAGVVARTIPAGRCAVLRHKGPLEFAEAAIRSLYRDWLPQSAEEPRDFPLFIQRLSFFPDVAEHEAETDIFLPLV
ncbi:AraC family transcriptional regulator [Roseibium sediminicola]|uniref:AraC family transcriptional regulator n=1 Tax=Roseibium sediminicola TaxID=2933272 RepID=A0ABT0H2H4_9HYPH|nr:AraC family transcriptional regulator [Roseibium sp. CAU 1639]MCK7615888.1 AraC family transcriptional regulator [Roseibium sp. CAU 1639]